MITTAWVGLYDEKKELVGSGVIYDGQPCPVLMHETAKLDTFRVVYPGHNNEDEYLPLGETTRGASVRGGCHIIFTWHCAANQPKEAADAQAVPG